MSRKVFLSFLGTTNYVACNYFYEQESHKVSNVRFVQEATLRLLCSGFNKQDQVLIFATKEAKKKNWEDNGQPEAVVKNDDERIGLKSRLISLKDDNLNMQIPNDPIEIPEGFSKDEVWNIFETVFSKLEEGDRIYLDITHSFRFVPMLATVLLQYAKFLKGIEVKSISYGAFEALGPAFAVRNIRLENRNAPIVEVLSLDTLQDWSSAANEFLNYGSAKKLSALTSTDIKPILIKTKGKDNQAKSLKTLTKALEQFTQEIRTSRGKNIVSGKQVGIIRQQLESIGEDSISALQPILQKVTNQIAVFHEHENIKNGMSAVKWCIDNHLTQQGFTLLQETIISIVAIEAGLDYKKETHRNIISSAFHIASTKKTENEWLGDAATDKTLTNKILKLEIIEKLRKGYASLTKFRNDLNHAGFKDEARKTERFRTKLLESYKEVIEQIS